MTFAIVTAALLVVGLLTAHGHLRLLGRRVGVSHRLVGVVATACVIFGAVGTACAETEFAESGDVTASLTYTGSFGEYSPLNVTIWRGDVDSYDEVVSTSDCDEPFCGPAFGPQP